MSFRVAIVTEPLDERIGVMSKALREYSANIQVRVLHCESGPRRSTAASAISRTVPCRTLRSLLAYRPHLVICKDFGRMALQAATYRSLSRRSRLLLCATEAPNRLGVFGRPILRAADAVLAEGEAVAQAVEQLRFPSSLIFPTTASTHLDPFFACRRRRPEAAARRIVFAGDLSPQSGAADLMIAVASWAEGNPNQEVDISWIGEGDLAGVLDAQPLPPGVTQRFLGRLDPQALAATFAQCGLLAVPSLVDDRRAPVMEALAAGLPVLGSRLDRNVRRWVHDGANGWLFNPLRPDEMTAALSRALDSPAGSLEQMRDHAQATVRPATNRGLSERLARAFAVVMPDFAPDFTPNALAHPAP